MQTPFFRSQDEPDWTALTALVQRLVRARGLDEDTIGATLEKLLRSYRGGADTATIERILPTVTVRAGIDQFRRRRHEVTTDEEGVVTANQRRRDGDPEPEAERGFWLDVEAQEVADHLAIARRRIALVETLECPICFAHGQTCPRPDLVRQVAAAFLLAVTHEDALPAQDEQRIRDAAIAAGVLDPSARNSSSTAGRAYMRSTTVCAAHLVHVALVRPGRSEVALLVIDAAERRRATGRWSAADEEAMRAWAEDNRVSWTAR